MIQKFESSLEGGAESSLAALRKNVSNGIEMILSHRQVTPTSAADRKSIWKLQASAATETVANRLRSLGTAAAGMCFCHKEPQYVY